MNATGFDGISARILLPGGANTVPIPHHAVIEETMVCKEMMTIPSSTPRAILILLANRAVLDEVKRKG